MKLTDAIIQYEAMQNTLAFQQAKAEFWSRHEDDGLEAEVHVELDDTIKSDFNLETSLGTNILEIMQEIDPEHQHFYTCLYAKGGVMGFKVARDGSRYHKNAEQNADMKIIDAKFAFYQQVLQYADKVDSEETDPAKVYEAAIKACFENEEAQRAALQPIIDAEEKRYEIDTGYRKNAIAWYEKRKDDPKMVEQIKNHTLALEYFNLLHESKAQVREELITQMFE